jgi:transketolase
MNPPLNDLELEHNSWLYRRTLLQAITRAGAGHTGGSLSCIDILNVLYNRILNVPVDTWPDPRRDRFVQSKGHSVEALYTVLAHRGFFPASDLDTLCQFQSPFVGHPTRKVPGIEHNTGALGHGLSFGVGLALAGRLDRADYRVFVLLGDGELAEGSNWEAAMAAAHHRLDHLVAVVDLNALQITGPVADVCANEPVDAKFRAFGWTVRDTDGHHLPRLTQALSLPPDTGKPTVVLAHTTKGKGISFIENQVGWHHRVPTAAELEQACREIDAALARLNTPSA